MDIKINLRCSNCTNRDHYICQMF